MGRFNRYAENWAFNLPIECNLHIVNVALKSHLVLSVAKHMVVLPILSSYTRAIYGFSCDVVCYDLIFTFTMGRLHTYYLIYLCENCRGPTTSYAG